MASHRLAISRTRTGVYHYNLRVVSRQTHLGIPLPGLHHATGAGSWLAPSLFTRSMVIAGNTYLFPAGFVVAGIYHISNHQARLVVWLVNAVANSYHHRLVSSYISWRQIHRIQFAACL